MSLQQRVLRSTAANSFDVANRETRAVFLKLADGTEIEGTVHLAPGTRTLDLLNSARENYIAVTRATLGSGARPEAIPFLAVNKAHIAYLVEEPDRKR